MVFMAAEQVLSPMVHDSAEQAQPANFAEMRVVVVVLLLELAKHFQ
jgi:hypothetical protein